MTDRTIALNRREVPASNEQLSLFAARVVAIPAKKLTLDEWFEAFNVANPQVYRAFVFVAREYLSATGRKHVGAKAVWEELRWRYAVHSRGSDNDYALNNSFVSRYARLAASKEADLRDAFEFRKLRSRAA